MHLSTQDNLFAATSFHVKTVLLWLFPYVPRWFVPLPILPDYPSAKLWCFSHIYFNNDINADTAFELNKELREVENKIKLLTLTLGIEKQPIYLHLTTNGGIIYSAMSIIDCIKSLSVPVYTVIDGYVASAGTLISLAGEKRYMFENSYMLMPKNLQLYLCLQNKQLPRVQTVH